MEIHNGAEILEELRSLRESYAAALPEKLNEHTLAHAWRSGPRRLLLQRLTHSLAGSGSTFGYPALGEVARSADTCGRPEWVGPTETSSARSWKNCSASCTRRQPSIPPETAARHWNSLYTKRGGK